MDEASFHNSIIARALSLWERLEHRTRLAFGASDSSARERRIKEWERVLGTERVGLTYRLTWDGIEPEILSQVIGAEVAFSDHAGINSTQRPSWIETLREILASDSLTADCLQYAKSATAPHVAGTEEVHEFARVFHPLASWACEKLHARGDPAAALSEEARTDLLHALTWRLCKLGEKALHGEFSLFAVRNGISTLDLLLAQEQGARSLTNAFENSLLERGYCKLFECYPVLGRVIAQAIDAWSANSKEFINRFINDREEMQEVFRLGSGTLQIRRVHSWRSDPHHHGQTVIELELSNGTMLFYKPRPLDIDTWFGALTTRMNVALGREAFRNAQILPRTGYGWCRKVAHAPPADLALLGRNLGALLAVVHACQGTDLHAENVIISGEIPVLVDLEALLQPQLQRAVKSESTGVECYREASLRLERSVLHSGLLPFWRTSYEADFEYDGSLFGLTAESAENASTEKEEQSPRGPFFGPTNASLFAQCDRFALPASMLSPSTREQILAGFEEAYVALIRERVAILSTADVPCFEVRFVARPTMAYEWLLHYSLEPQFLRDGVDWSIALDTLTHGFPMQPEPSLWWSLVRHEREALEEGDIPCFSLACNSCDLVLGEKKLLHNCFSESPAHRFCAQMARLDHADLREQMEIIEVSLAGSASSDAEAAEPATTLVLTHVHAEEKESGTQPAQDVRAIVDSIRNVLRERAITGSDASVSWMGICPAKGRQRFNYGSIGIGLYEGNLGIALFLAAARKVFNDHSYDDLLQQTLRPIRAYIELKRVAELGLSGIGGLVWGLHQIALLAEMPELDELTEKILIDLPAEAVRNDTALDVMSGSAGLLLALTGSSYSSNRTTALAQSSAERLVAMQRAGEHGGAAWPTIDGALLTGLSHGAAGISLALLRHWQVTQDPRILKAAEEGIKYERGLFSKERGNWPDLRVFPDGSRGEFACSWCHGAPGIGLSRILFFELLKDPLYLEEIRSALHTTLATSESEMLQLCCGRTGCVEFLVRAAQLCGDPPQQAEVAQQASQLLHNVKETGEFPCFPGVSPAVLSPGLFQGVSGIGFYLLRTVAPGVLPDPLLLSQGSGQYVNGSA